MRKITDQLKCRKCGNVKNGNEFYQNYSSGTMQSWCKDCTRLSTNARRRQNKQDCIKAYGGQCECCGEKNVEFLSIDHIFKDGKVHRKEIGVNKLYWFLKKNGYPKDRYRLLCFNCNCSLGFFGYCPHNL